MFSNNVTKIYQSKLDTMFKIELSKLDLQERNKVNMLIAETMRTGGQVAVDNLKREFLGMPAVTRELQVYTATQQEAANLTVKALNDATDKTITLDEFQTEQSTRLESQIEARVRALKKFETAVMAAEAGLDGVPAEIRDLLLAGDLRWMQYVDDSGNFMVDAWRKNWEESH